MKHPYDMDLTPKQCENWERHGEPVYAAISDVFSNDEIEIGHGLSVETVRDYYVRLVRPKKRGDGMMDRDEVSLSGDTELNYIRKEVDDWFAPMKPLDGLMMARMMVRGDVGRLEEVARVIALAKLSVASPEYRQRVAAQHARRGRAYGIN